MKYPDFFQTATGLTPYTYQIRLACGEQNSRAEPDWHSSGAPCHSRLIAIPTGLGKTAAVVLAWLWNRIAHPDPAHRATWPRRLVYCLPMRTLVEQTRDNVRNWLANLHAKARELGLDDAAKADLAWLVGDGTPEHPAHSPIILMGGEDLDPARRDCDLYPEKPAILIGTQDMLLSRALNRGYGMSRYRWPLHFALLNNDCLWVMDETQLMGSGLSTACQLEAFRNMLPQGFGSFGTAGSVTWYLSATHNPDLLQTRDWRDSKRLDGFEFGLSQAEKDATCGPIHQRRHAKKRLELKDTCNFDGASLIDEVLKQHNEMVEKIGGDPKLPARTLIICNTVDRAVAVYQQLEVKKPRGCDLLLMHSRFRPPERREQVRRLMDFTPLQFPGGQIVVATQVIEAGVDISSGLLWSEIAPLASLVQRLGRLNRAGEFNGSSNWQPKAFIVGIGLEPAPPRETKEQKNKRERENAQRALPYDLSVCEAAWTSFAKLNGDASPANLETIQADIAASIPRCPYSLQRHELLDFFDTDANLSLGFTDVSPFVRGLDADTDLHVLWRESWTQKDGGEGTGEPGFTPDYLREELCPVPISKAKDARDILNQGWVWRGKDSGWISVRDAGLAPGMTILLPLSAGGYDILTGWTGKASDTNFQPAYKPDIEPPDEELLSYLSSGWRSIAAHTAEVEDELRQLLSSFMSPGERAQERDALLAAALWHDLGKSHVRWQEAAQNALCEACVPEDRIKPHLPLAKFSLAESTRLCGLTGDGLKKEIARLKRLFRPALAHEVASALAFRQAEQKCLGSARDTDLASLLAEYLIMSHHGRVRKVLRDELPKFPSNEKDTNTVRGIHESDSLPPVVIAGQSLGCAALSIDCRKMGRAGPDGHESYTRGVLRLLDHYGPFQLAFFEAVFRAADARASRKAVAPAQPVAACGVPPSLELREEPPPYGTAPALSPAEQALVADLVADGLNIQDKFRPEPLYKQTGKGHYEANTVEEIRRARQTKPEGGRS